MAPRRRIRGIHRLEKRLEFNMPMTPKQLGITKRQYDNIEKLIAYGESVALTFHVFDMTVFFTDENEESINPSKSVTHYKNECGTTACFAGLGPLAGVSGKGFSLWWDYIEIKFGAFSASGQYRWMFHHNWATVDNTLAGACKRARIFLESGIPDDWDYHDRSTWLPYAA